MAVLKTKPKRIVDFFLGMMERELVLPQLVTRIPESYFIGSLGDTVNLRIRGAQAVARDYEWRTRTAPIQYDDIEQREDSIPVVLDTHTYSATKLTDEHMRLDEIDFADEVLGEQVEAVVRRLEARIAYGLANEPFKNTLEFTPDSDPLKVGAEAKRLLSSSKVAPKRGRFFLVGENIAAHWEVSKRMTDPLVAGNAANPSALTENTIGRLGNVPVVVSEMLPEGVAYLMHPSAFGMANVAPRVPGSIKNGAVQTTRSGYAVRWMTHYDKDFLSDASIVSTFHGLSGIRDERQLTGAKAGDLLAIGNSARGTKNVRGIKLVGDGFGAIDLDYTPLLTKEVEPAGA